MNILTGRSVSDIWQNAIKEALIHNHAVIESRLETYLINLLIHYTKKTELFKSLFAVSYLSNFLEENPAQKQLVFQEIGDGCLLFSGLFPDLAKKRVALLYFVNMGRHAYDALSQTNDLFASLSVNFVDLMDTLQAIRDHTENYPSLTPLDAYEQWSELGSKRARKILQLYSPQGLPNSNRSKY